MVGFRLFLFLWGVSTFGPALLSAQPPQEVLDRLFDGMRRGDTVGMYALFHPEASLHSLVVEGGDTLLREGPIETWRIAHYTLSVAVPNEQIEAYRRLIESDGE